MSGHSKWSTIKHKKGALDAARGKVFSKIIKEITVATRIGGDQMNANPRLKAAVEKAKSVNMPGKNIENAIKRGAGTMEGVEYQEIVYEGYGPNGVALIIKCLTDNKNRSVSEVRSTLSKNGGAFGESGSVSWQFDLKGVIAVAKEKYPNEDAFMELAIEAGADDVLIEEGGYTIYTSVPNLHIVTEALREKKVEIAESEIEYVPKQLVPVTADQADRVQRLIDVLDELDDVQSIASNEEVTG